MRFGLYRVNLPQGSQVSLENTYKAHFVMGVPLHHEKTDSLAQNMSLDM
jgi:hypothetical protein